MVWGCMVCVCLYEGVYCGVFVLCICFFDIWVECCGRDFGFDVVVGRWEFLIFSFVFFSYSEVGRRKLEIVRISVGEIIIIFFFFCVDLVLVW